MPLPTLTDYYGRQDPAPNWRWIAFMPSLPQPSEGMLPTDYNVVDLGDRPLHLESFSLPMPHIDSQPMFVASSREYYPNFYDIENFTVSFVEDASYLVFRYLTTWRQLVVDKNNSWGIPGDGGNGFKQTINVQLFGWDDEAVISINLLGAWPTSYPNYDLQYQTSGFITTGANFSADSWEPDPDFTVPGGNIAANPGFLPGGV